MKKNNIGEITGLFVKGKPIIAWDNGIIMVWKKTFQLFYCYKKWKCGYCNFSGNIFALLRHKGEKYKEGQNHYKNPDSIISKKRIWTFINMKKK